MRMKYKDFGMVNQISKLLIVWKCDIYLNYNINWIIICIYGKIVYGMWQCLTHLCVFLKKIFIGIRSIKNKGFIY